MIKYNIYCYKWFDKLNGNTYHAVNRSKRYANWSKWYADRSKEYADKSKRY